MFNNIFFVVEEIKKELMIFIFTCKISIHYTHFTLFFTCIYKTASIHMSQALIFRCAKKVSVVYPIFAVARWPLLVTQY